MAERKATTGKLGEEKGTGLGLTPLIDVVFLLLIFFLIAARLKAPEGEIKVYLPKDRGQGVASRVDFPDDLRVKLLWYDDKDRATTDPDAGHVVLEIGKKVYPSELRFDSVTRRYESVPDWVYFESSLVDFRDGYRGAGGKGLPVIIDAREEVPWKHVVSAIDACMRAGIEDVTFAAPSKPID